MQFCQRLGTEALPAAKHTVALFAAELSCCLAPATIRVYLAAVSLLHHRVGLSSPTQHNPSLKLAMHGIQRYHHQHHSQYCKRSPITTTILKHLLNFLSTTQRWNRHDRAMLKDTLALAFYGFLQGSEFTIPTLKAFDPGYTQHQQISPSPGHRSTSTSNTPRPISSHRAIQSGWASAVGDTGRSG